MKKLPILLSLVLTGLASSAQTSGGVGIGTITPDASALLDISSTSKGFLAPRVALTGTSDVSTIINPAAGLLVYNTAAAGSGNAAVTSGYYYYDGTQWNRFVSSGIADPTVGTIVAFPGNNIGQGYLQCNGAAISRATYVTLFAMIGTTYGAGDGSTTFNLPDLRGEFIRGFDNGRGVDAGRGIGTSQAASYTAIAGGNNNAVETSGSDIVHIYSNGSNVPTNWENITALGGAQGWGSTGSTGASNAYAGQVRPRNIAMVYAIKALPSLVNSTNTIIYDTIYATQSGQILKTTILTDPLVTLSGSGSGNLIYTSTYIPSSPNCKLLIEFDADYSIGGSSSDQFSSEIIVNGTSIRKKQQYFNNAGGGGTRSGVLLPIMGSYTNGSTSAKTIQISLKQVSADDGIYDDGNVKIMKITEIQN